MLIESDQGYVGVIAERSDPPDTIKKAAAVLGIFCAEGAGVEVADGCALAKLASDASPDSAILLLENIASTHTVEGSLTLAEEARHDLVLDDGLPFVMNH